MAKPSTSGAAALERASADKLVSIGAELRALRRARGLTLTELSEKTGLSIGYLSQVERGKSALSVQKLYVVSRTLGVGVQWFFHALSEDPNDERRYIVRGQARRRMDYGTGIIDELLSPHLEASHALLLTRLAPGTNSGDAMESRGDDQAGFVLQGQLTLWIEDREFHLAAGDSFLVGKLLPFRYANPGPEETLAVWVIAPPSL